MPKKTQMTDRIYEYLQTVIPEQGYAPSVREICEAVGLKSPSTVHFHLKRLQERGLIEKGDFKGRAIVLATQRDKFCNTCSCTSKKFFIFFPGGNASRPSSGELVSFGLQIRKRMLY